MDDSNLSNSSDLQHSSAPAPMPQPAQNPTPNLAPSPNSAPVPPIPVPQPTPVVPTSPPAPAQVPTSQVIPPTNPQSPPPLNSKVQASASTPISDEIEKVVEEKETSVAQAFKKKRRRKTIPLAIGITLFLLSSISGLAYAVAYEKLPIKVPTVIEQKTQHLVMSLPFAPKNPKYILEKSAMAQSDISRYSFNASMSAQASEFEDIFNTSRFDMQFVGKTDTSNLENVKLEVNGSITKDFNFDFKFVDNKAYFKINQLPELLFAFLGVKKTDLDPFLNQWVFYDTTPLETEASAYMDEAQENSPQDYYSQEKMEEWFAYLTSDEIVDKITLSEDTLDGEQVHKLHIDVDQNLIDSFKNKSIEIYDIDRSEISGDDLVEYEDFVIDVWITKDSYYPVKFASNLKMIPDTSGLSSMSNQVLGDNTFSDQVLGDSTFSQNPEVTIAFVVSLSDIQQEVEITVPSVTTSLEEYILQIQTFVVTYMEEDYSQNPEQYLLENPEIPAEDDSAVQNYETPKSGFGQLIE